MRLLMTQIKKNPESNSEKKIVVVDCKFNVTK